MKLTTTQYAQALYDATVETGPKDHDKVLDNFVKILAENGDLPKIDDIEKEFKRIEREAKGIKEVNVTFAHSLENNSKIMDELNKVVEGKVEFKTTVDESIIGGVVVRVENTLIDGSVKTQLNNLNNQLKQ
jgi:F-type H+-transporting ATPase subunit delta